MKINKIDPLFPKAPIVKPPSGTKFIPQDTRMYYEALEPEHSDSKLAFADALILFMIGLVVVSLLN
jgi:hypothetical protein